MNVTGLATYAGATHVISRSDASYNTVTTFSGGLRIENTTSGSYVPISIGAGDATNKGGKAVLGGNLEFVGNTTNSNTTVIESVAPTTGTNYGMIDLAAAQRTFLIGNGAADVDLQINAAIENGGIEKTGSGTLLLNGINSYTGNTTISEGVLSLGATGSIATSPRIEITAGASLDTSLQSFAMVGSQTIVFGLDAAGAGSAGLLDAAALDITGGSIDFATVGTLDDVAYVIASYSSLTGAAFANAPAVPGYQLDYAYQGNNIALVSAIPEPGTIALASLVCGMSLLARRRAVRV